MRPNVLLLVIDSLRADALFGSEAATPILDRLARRGVAFHQCVCSSTTTTPSFSSILTGCFPPRHGVRGLQGYRLSSSLATLPELLAGAGYDTQAEVTGPLLPETGVLRGFGNGNHRETEGAGFFDWRGSVLERMSSLSEPWFLLLHVWEVHNPYRSPPDLKKRQYRAGYVDAVSATDRRLAPILEAGGKDTLSVVTGDHGEEYPETAFGYWSGRVARNLIRRSGLARRFPDLMERLAIMSIGHGFALHEHLIRVPLVIEGPGIHPKVVEQQVRHVDLLPTLCELCGIEAPDGIDGRSLRPVMEEGWISEEMAYIEAVGMALQGRRMAAARTSARKLIEHPDGRLEYQVLDGDLAGGSEPAEQVEEREIMSQLEAFIERVQASDSGASAGMSKEEEVVVERHLRDLGYL